MHQLALDAAQLAYAICCLHGCHAIVEPWNAVLVVLVVAAISPGSHVQAGHSATLARRDDLVRVERVAGDAASRDIAKPFAVVVDDGQTGESSSVLSVEMDGYYRFRALRAQLGDMRPVDCSARQHISQDRFGTDGEHRRCHGRKGQIRDDDFVPGFDAERHQGQVNRCGPGRADERWRPEILGEPLLEPRHPWCAVGKLSAL